MSESTYHPDVASADRLVRRRTLLPLLLLLSAWLVGGVAFSSATMVTLLARELRHFLQARRYGVPASYPYFIPMLASPIGTMGPVIAIKPGRRSSADAG